MPAATDKSDAGRSDAGRSAFLAGLRDGAPMVLGVAPFGLLFAVVASEAGLDILQVMGMSVLVIAGAAQFTALAQMQDGAPMFMVLAAALTSVIVALGLSFLPHSAGLMVAALAAMAVGAAVEALGGRPR